MKVSQVFCFDNIYTSWPDLIILFAFYALNLQISNFLFYWTDVSRLIRDRLRASRYLLVSNIKFYSVSWIFSINVFTILPNTCFKRWTEQCHMHAVWLSLTLRTYVLDCGTAPVSWAAETGCDVTGCYRRLLVYFNAGGGLRCRFATLVNSEDRFGGVDVPLRRYYYWRTNCLIESY